MATPRQAIAAGRLATAALAALTLALWGSPRMALGQGLPTDMRSELERRASAMVDTLPMPGMAVGVVEENRLLYSGGFGVANRETGARVRGSTLFQIGSVTKPITAALAGVLVDRGRLSWDDRLVDHLPLDLTLPDSSITIGQLASHTSGLPAYPANLRRKHDDYPILAYSHFELHRGIEAAEPEFSPGTDWSYSNFGYGVLGHVLERASGSPFEPLLEAELLEPLGMESTTVTLWPELRPRLATPYYHDEDSDELRRYTPWDMEALAPAGGVTSSVEDLARFVSFLFRARDGEEDRLTASTIRRQQSGIHPLSGGGSYGMGWFVEEREGMGTVLFHGGGVDGYTAWLALAPDRELGVIVLVNSGAGAAVVGLSDWILAELVARGEGASSPP